MADSSDKKNRKKIHPSNDDEAIELLKAHLDAFEPPVKDVDSSLPPIEIKGKSKKKPKQLELDLHGQTVSEAKLSCDQLLRSINPGAQIDIKIITGKGRHSGNEGPTLISEIYNYINSKYKNNIVSIDSPPADDRLNGLPLRGFFDLKFKL